MTTFMFDQSIGRKAGDQQRTAAYEELDLEPAPPDLPLNNALERLQQALEALEEAARRN
jgi:hypothetical protein